MGKIYNKAIEDRNKKREEKFEEIQKKIDVLKEKKEKK